jgi:hypothetical protein
MAQETKLDGSRTIHCPGTHLLPHLFMHLYLNPNRYLYVYQRGHKAHARHRASSAAGVHPAGRPAQAQPGPPAGARRGPPAQCLGWRCRAVGRWVSGRVRACVRSCVRACVRACVRGIDEDQPQAAAAVTAYAGPSARDGLLGEGAEQLVEVGPRLAPARRLEPPAREVLHHLRACARAVSVSGGGGGGERERRNTAATAVSVCARCL